MKVDAARRQALVEHARRTIKVGSQSFSAASKLFDPETRERAWLLYAWCRQCDDIADNQVMGGELGDQSDLDSRLNLIRKLTAKAFAGEPTGDPAFDALGVVAEECGLTPAMAEDVIAGFALDAEDWRPREESDMLQYCFHVAGAVGVMMAVVMGVDPEDQDTLDRANDLGLAFQLSNIARDIVEDDAVGRCYLPLMWLVEEDIEPGQHTKPHHRQELADMAERLVALVEKHEAAARVGAARLPFRSRWAVLSAARIYGAIGRKVRKRGTEAWNSRTYVPRYEKAWHGARAFLSAVINREKHPDGPITWGIADFRPNA
ncbi:phytoene/squalene synthase family protein [Erythrobacter sp. F6033]|uniref:phytoene/squalene synthase family protein n=1 Tax=Erythrobacter sp. F6033 TaxID=2926401 RepID=UPI001FF5A096|nr:phytoene/squalene synthase family protein [Erythrobacter sp. F6033]MCK0127415.1 phytoene/squalene synthase family protein [Erythrobacter sp. F6033]